MGAEYPGLSSTAIGMARIAVALKRRVIIGYGKISQVKRRDND
jgi:hypothetical protein